MAESYSLISGTKLVVEGLLMPLVTLFGLVGNTLSILVLQSPNIDMKVTFRQVLTMLAVFDCIFITMAAVCFSLPQLSTYWKAWLHPHLFPWLLPFIQISLNGSIWSTVSVTVERYISVVHPRHWFGSFTSAIYIVPVVLFTVIWNIPRFAELNTCYDHRNITEHQVIIEVEVPRICPTSLRRNLSYTRDYILIANFLGMALLPFFLLAVLNFRLYTTIKESGLRNQTTTRRQKRDHKIASLLLLVVLVFGCCNFVRIITNLYEVFLVAFHGSAEESWPEWCDLLTYLSHLLLVLNSSSNIVIYCWKDEKFRKVLMCLLGWQKRQINGSFTNTSASKGYGMRDREGSVCQTEMCQLTTFTTEMDVLEEEGGEGIIEEQIGEEDTIKIVDAEKHSNIDVGKEGSREKN